MLFSNQALAMPIHELSDLCDYGIQYQLTGDELVWLEFVTGRYDIADVIRENMTGSGVLTVDSYAFSKAMDQDTANSGGFAACLGRDTALALILWVGYINPNDD